MSENWELYAKRSLSDMTKHIFQGKLNIYANSARLDVFPANPSASINIY